MSTTTLPEAEMNLRSMGAETDDSQGEIPDELPPAEEIPSSDPEPEGGKVKPEEKKKTAPKPATEETLYAKARRLAAEKQEKEVLARKAFDAEKTAFAAEKQKIEDEKKEAARIRQEAIDSQPIRDDKGYSASDYEAFAKKCRDDGDTEMARLAQEQAGKIRTAESQRHQQFHQRKLVEGILSVVEKRQEFKDPQSKEGLALTAILNQFPVLKNVPGGFAAAVAMYDAQRDSSTLPELRKKLDNLEKENKRLNGLTSLPLNSPARKGEGKAAKNTERDIRRMAEEADLNPTFA